MERKSKINTQTKTEKTDGSSSPELGMALANVIIVRKWQLGQVGTPPHGGSRQNLAAELPMTASELGGCLDGPAVSS